MKTISEKLIYERKVTLSGATGTNYLRSDKVKPGRIQKTKIIVVENKTSPYTRLRIGIYDNGTFYNYFEEMNPQAGQLYFTCDEMILREGQQVQAELTGCTAADSLEMYVHGMWEEDVWVEPALKLSEEKPQL